MPLKLLLISVAGTMCHDGRVNMNVAREMGRLTRELVPLGVQVALWSNRPWTVNRRPMADWFSEIAQVPVPHHGAQVDGSPARQLGNSARPIMERYQVQRHETVLVGASDEDMRAGVQNKLLMLRPEWYGAQSEYGFPVRNIRELARFCLVFALREHPIFWRVQDGALDISTAGPFSTKREAYRMFGEDARAFAKGGDGRPDFWFNFAVSSLYFSGLLEGVNYICTIPGHSPDSALNKYGMADVLSLLGKCFRMTFYNDLVERHSLARKSQFIRAADRTFRNQLNTIRLVQRPHRYLTLEALKNPINLRGKTVLVVDDFCTSGRSNEAVRAYIEAAGGHARLFSWMKTINVPYARIREPLELRPYIANQVAAEPDAREYSYYGNIVAPEAPDEIHDIFVRYRDWNW